jgi:hypothetical protein
MKAIRGPDPAFSAEMSHLPYPALQRLVGQVLLDPGFGARFLNGSRAEILSQADFLSAQERAFLLTIQASTPQELARAILDHSLADNHVEQDLI